MNMYRILFWYSTEKSQFVRLFDIASDWVQVVQVSESEKHCIG